MPRKNKSAAGLEVKSPPANNAGAEFLRLLILVGIPTLIYAQTVHFPFINYDDPAIAQNKHLYSGLTWENIVWAFTSFDFVLYQPLLWLSHLTEVEFFGGSPGVFHTGNVLLHIANTLLLYYSLRAMTSAPQRSACVAAMFAAHPLHVESVAWIAERKDVLSTLFMLVSLLLYIGYVRRNSFWLYAVCWFCFLLAMLSKPMVVTFPCILLLLDVWPLRRLQGISSDLPGTGPLPVARSWVRLVVEKLPFVALVPLAYLSAVIGHDMDLQQGHWIKEPLAIGYRILNAIYVYGAYLWKTIWPDSLAIYYPHPKENISLPLVALSAFVLVSVTALSLWQWRRRPYLAIGWLWYLGTLFPVIKIIEFGGPFQMADRFTYVPLVGIFLSVVWLVGDWADRNPARLKVAWSGGALLISLWTAVATTQTSYWRSSVTLMRHSLAVTQDNDHANLMLADALIFEGKLAEAVGPLEEAISITPDSPREQHTLGQVYYQLGQPEKAIGPLTELVLLVPKDPVAHHDLGLALLDSHQYSPALVSLENARGLDPENAEFRETLISAYIEYGTERLAASDLQRALQLFEKALLVDSKNVAAHHGLGMVYAQLGQPEPAARHLQLAVELNPTNPHYEKDLPNTKAGNLD